MIENWREPRHQCLSFMMEQTKGEGKFECLSEEEFNKLVESEKFEVGPFKEDFGSGHGEPYNPWRQAFGKLKDGRLVFTELYKEKS